MKIGGNYVCTPYDPYYWIIRCMYTVSSPDALQISKPDLSHCGTARLMDGWMDGWMAGWCISHDLLLVDNLSHHAFALPFLRSLVGERL